MKRIVTGVQASGKPHLGNLLGLILPALSSQDNNEYFFFIADLHALTTVKDPIKLQENTRSLAAAWIACGLDEKRHYFYRQSRVPVVTELNWYLSCLTPYPMLANSHAFKAKADRLHDVNAGLFTYPVLMAADILLYDAHYVPVGKDQIQHVEIARDIAQRFNALYGDTFVIPEVVVETTTLTVPGTDGQKMSKSYNNIIDIFQEDNQLLKQIKQIKTDSKTQEEKKDPETCNVFQIFQRVADATDTATLANQYRAGGLGYGHAKEALFEVLKKRFVKERERYKELIEDEDYLLKLLSDNEQRVSKLADQKMQLVRKAIGF